MQSGAASFHAKDYLKAHDVFQELVSKGPRHHDAAYNLANSFLALRDGKGLVETSRALLDIDALGLNNFRLLAKGYSLLADSGGASDCPSVLLETPHDRLTGNGQPYIGDGERSMHDHFQDAVLPRDLGFNRINSE